jgi:putative N6-adenine-specific DNA methylase
VRVFATAHPGCEAILERELRSLGVGGGLIGQGGVELEVDEATVARLNLELRTAGRILVRMAEFSARTFPELERHAIRLGWEQYLGAGAAAHFRVTAKKSKLNHERAIAERLTRALQQRSPATVMVESRSEVLDQDDDPASVPRVQRFVVRLHRDTCTISADSSGPLLHRRGYRIETGKAPLRETLAASLLLAIEWDGDTPLLDPMCGSGTIPIEAAMMAARIPAGLRRRFSFERWPLFAGTDVSALRAGLEAARRPIERGLILGSDRDAGVVAAAEANAERAGLHESVHWHRAAVSAMEPRSTTGWVVTNPPYGGRLGDRRALRDLYAQLGNVLRRRFAGWRVALISADRMLEGQVGLAWRTLATTENGGLPVRFLMADITGK